MKNPYTLIGYRKGMTQGQVEINNSKFWEWENKILEKEKIIKKNNK